MSGTVRSSLLGALLVAGAASALNAQDRPMKGYWRCDTNNGPATIYATPFMDWTGMGQEVGTGFQQYLQAKYGYKGQVLCSRANPGNDLAKLQADMQRQYAQFRAQGKSVVEVPWTITSPGVTLPYACFGLGQVSRDSAFNLYSKVFRVPVGGSDDLSNSWVNHLKRIHPEWYFPQQAGCILLPADPARHQEIIQSQLGLWSNVKAKVVEVDWQYQAGADAATEAEEKKPAYYCEKIGSKPKTVFITPVRAADPAWKREEYDRAWALHVQSTFDKEAYTGGCEAGTRMQENVAMARRKQGYVDQGYTVKEVDWEYRPGAAPTPPPAPANAPKPPPPPPPASAQAPSASEYPSKDGLGRPVPMQTFYCQYLGLAHDGSGKYPLYQNEMFSMATMAGSVQNGWKKFIETTYHPSSPGNPMCVAVPDDPVQREGVLKSFNLLTQPATQTVVKVNWKP
jgi:hypothetical protein